MKYFIFLPLLVMMSSCTNPGDFGGYRLDGNGYMKRDIVLDKGEVIHAGDTPEEEARKGTLIKFHRNSGVIDSFWAGNGNRVVGAFVDVDRVRFDESFILVGQKPIDSICECNDDCLFGRFENLRGELGSYEVCKDALDASTYYNYWIIDKTDDAIFGPFLKDVFLEKRKELGVPESLEYPLNLSR